MLSDNGCRICGARVELAYRGGPVTLMPEGFAPAEHRVGAHGDLYRCTECGTVQQPALPDAEQLHDLYRRMRDERYLAEEEGRRRAARRLLDHLHEHAPSGRLLDVGCGYGLLLDEARRRGYEAVGVELSAHGVTHARDKLGLQVVESSIEQAGLEPGSFDAIVVVDVFEHLDDPVAALQLCAELLSPGGALLLTTPDPSSLTARLAGSRWWSHLLAHRCLVPRSTMRELLAACGLLAAGEHPYVRVFSPGYWLAGLSERIGPLDRLVQRASRALPEDLLLSAALRDEWTYIARRIEVLQPPHPLAADRGQAAKVHAVIPAHNAERTIEQVARALPAASIDRALMVDDASSDGTVATALAAGLEVLPHPSRRGSGANQKTGYVRAALDGADVVVMVHGEHRYDPALLSEMTSTIIDGTADVVIGSRLPQDKAIAGGRARCKWVGNRALTWVENAAFRRSYSDYHTGYRAFSLAFLRTIPFLRNSDGFGFDQEIFAQMIARDARVVELAIPTRYFLQASPVSFADSVRYAVKTLVILVRFRSDSKRRRWPLLRRPAVSLEARLSPQQPSSPALAGQAGP